MNLDRSRLDSILSVLGTAVGNKVMEVAKFVCFKVDKQNQTVVLATTDFHAYLTMDFGDVTLAGLEGMPDMFLIDYRELSAVVSGSTTDMVEFTDDGDNIIVSTNGRYRFRKYLDTNLFPSADMKHTVAASWPVPEIQAAWSKARIACSKDVTKINYQGIYFDGNFAATDNRRLSVVNGGEYDGNPMLIPPVFGDVLKHCKNSVDVGVNDVGNLLVIACKEVGMMAGVRLIDATFVPYENIISGKKPSATVVVKKQEMLGALQRLSIFSDKLFKVVELSLIENADESYSLKMVIDNNDAGEEVMDPIGVDVTDKNTLLDMRDKMPDGFVMQHHMYHIDNLCDGIAAVDSPEEVTIEFQDDGKLWVIEENYTYLLSAIQ